MIHIIDYIVGADGLGLFIAWDRDCISQEDRELENGELLELLLQAGYICDYHQHNGADVAVLIDGFKYWTDLQSFLRDELSDQMCINLLQEQLKQV